MSSNRTPDPEFVKYMETEVRNPYLSAATVVQMGEPGLIILGDVRMCDREEFERVFKSVFKGHRMTRGSNGDYVGVVPWAAWKVWQAERAQKPSLTPLAQKKLDQMGATVHGVLVKNEAGSWAAVSDAGRVMWLDDFEGQTVRAQGGEAVAEVTRDHMVGVKFFENTEFGTALEAGTKLYIHPSASVPEALILRKQAEAVELMAEKVKEAGSLASTESIYEGLLSYAFKYRQAADEAEQ